MIIFFFKFNKCEVKPTSKRYRMSGLIHVKNGDVRALKQVVALYGPVSIGLNTSLTSFGSYSSGIFDGLEFNSEKMCDDIIDHAVLLMGYDTVNGTDVWIIKNQWQNWGISGYMYLKRDETNICGVASYAWVPFLNNCEQFD